MQKNQTRCYTSTLFCGCWSWCEKKRGGGSENCKQIPQIQSSSSSGYLCLIARAIKLDLAGSREFIHLGRNGMTPNHFDLNLPGSTSYTPSRAWITKQQIDGSLASDIRVFIDDKRLVGSGQTEVREAGHQCSNRESYMGIQDALQKWRLTGGTCTLGAWAGAVVHVEPTRGVLVLTSQEKWDRMKNICNHWLTLLWDGETALAHKQLHTVQINIFRLSEFYITVMLCKM